MDGKGPEDTLVLQPDFEVAHEVADTVRFGVAVNLLTAAALRAGVRAVLVHRASSAAMAFSASPAAAAAIATAALAAAGTHVVYSSAAAAAAAAAARSSSTGSTGSAAGGGAGGSVPPPPARGVLQRYASASAAVEVPEDAPAFGCDSEWVAWYSSHEFLASWRAVAERHFKTLFTPSPAAVADIIAEWRAALHAAYPAVGMAWPPAVNDRLAAFVEEVAVLAAWCEVANSHLRLLAPAVGVGAGGEYVPLVVPHDRARMTVCETGGVPRGYRTTGAMPVGIYPVTRRTQPVPWAAVLGGDAAVLFPTDDGSGDVGGSRMPVLVAFDPPAAAAPVAAALAVVHGVAPSDAATVAAPAPADDAGTDSKAEGKSEAVAAE